MRFLSAAAALFSALFLLLGVSVAHADPSFVLTQSGAGPGDRVHFSISGIESRATYSVEVDGEEVAEGSAPAGSGVSGEFTMPNLGDTSRGVTVEAQITQSDETTTRARNLQYLAPSKASTSGPQPAAVLTQPAAQSAPASGPANSSQRMRPASRPAAGNRRARRSPRRAPERNARERQRSMRAGELRPSRGLFDLASATSGSASSAAPRSVGKQKPLSTAESGNRPPSGRRDSVGPDATTRLTTFLTGPLTPAIFSLAPGVAGNGDGGGGVPVAAAIVLPLLGLSALILAGGGLAPKRRPTRVEGLEFDDRDDRDYRGDGILQRFIYVPGSRSAPGWTGRLPSSERPALDVFASPNGPAKRSEEPILAEAMAVPLHQAAASFESIPLAVLDRRATLATRAERKYILDARTFGRLVGELVPHYLILEIDGERVFPYNTVYFDTPARTTYRQHLQGRRRRFKCRTRLYAASGPCFFEVKLKGGRGETIKRRLELGVEEHGSLTRPALVFLEHELDRAYGTCPPAALAPVLRTLYRRLTLMGRDGSERLTFDFELMFAANGKEYSIQPGRILLETKTDVDAGEANGAGEAKRVLRRLGVRPVASCSKYCLGVALTHPELRDNLFRPLIRNHFDANRHAPARAYDRRAVASPTVELGGERQPGVPALPTWREVLALLTRRSSPSSNAP